MTDEELAKYFDEETPQAPVQGGGWSLDDAFANPHQGRTSDEDAAPHSRPRRESYDPQTPAPLKRPRLSDRQLHPVSRVSRVSVAPMAGDDLTWTGRDAKFEKPGGFGGKPVMLMVGMVAMCLVFVVLFGGDSGPTTGALPQIGR